MIKKNILYRFLREYIFLFFVLVISFSFTACSQNGKKTSPQKEKEQNVQVEKFRPEHIAFNVPEPIKMAHWYIKNLGMITVRKGATPADSYFIGDSGKHMMMELYHHKDYPELGFAKLDYNSMHLAFVVDDIKTIRKNLLAAGAKVAQELFTTPGGDQVMVLHDPWNLPIQFVQRKNPMFKYTGIRLEHIEFNVPDTHKKAKWYVDNLNMKIMREGGAPTYNMFISDSEHNMMFELNQNKDFPMLNFNKISPQSIHFAFTVNNINNVKNELIKAGASFVSQDTSAEGDKILMLRDPWGQPLQFLTRAKPMLK